MGPPRVIKDAVLEAPDPKFQAIVDQISEAWGSRNKGLVVKTRVAPIPGSNELWDAFLKDF